MPAGTDEEYLAGGAARRASEMIDSAVNEGKSGDEILSLMAEEGLRIYTKGEMAEEEAPLEEEPLEEIPEEGEEELPEEETLEEGASLEGESMPFGAPGEPTPGAEGGMRDLRIEAVKYALNKDKEKRGREETPV